MLFYMATRNAPDRAMLSLVTFFLGIYESNIYFKILCFVVLKLFMIKFISVLTNAHNIITYYQKLQ